VEPAPEEQVQQRNRAVSEGSAKSVETNNDVRHASIQVEELPSNWRGQAGTQSANNKVAMPWEQSQQWQPYLGGNNYGLHKPEGSKLLINPVTGKRDFMYTYRAQSQGAPSSIVDTRQELRSGNSQPTKYDLMMQQYSDEKIADWYGPTAPIAEGLPTALMIASPEILAPKVVLQIGAINGGFNALGTYATSGNPRDAVIAGVGGFVVSTAAEGVRGEGLLFNTIKGGVSNSISSVATQSYDIYTNDKTFAKDFNVGDVVGSAVGGAWSGAITSPARKVFLEQLSAGIVGFAPQVATGAVGHELGKPKDK